MATVLGNIAPSGIGNALVGAHWEAQRRITGMTLNQIATSVIEVGALPVIMLTRIFAYTGKGVIARVYRAPTFTVGTLDPMYNMNDAITPPARLVGLRTGITLTANGTEIAAPQFFIGPASNASKGLSASGIGGGRILAPNTKYLLTFESLEAAQDVTARIELLEGSYDFSGWFNGS
jgi:hypothetical protein